MLGCYLLSQNTCLYMYFRNIFLHVGQVNISARSYGIPGQLLEPARVNAEQRIVDLVVS
jgi:hypothetical protein